MKQSTGLKPKKTVRDLKLEMIEMLKEEFGSDPFIDQLQREVNEDSQPKEIRVVGTVAPKK